MNRSQDIRNAIDTAIAHATKHDYNAAQRYLDIAEALIDGTAAVDQAGRTMRITEARIVEIDPRTDLRILGRGASAAELANLNHQLSSGKARITGDLFGWPPHTHTVRGESYQDTAGWVDTDFHARIES